MTPEEEDAWLESRWNYVTGSRIAILMGDNPWCTPEELLQQYIKKEDNFTSNRKMEWGKLMEVGVLEAIGAFTGWYIRPTHEMVTREFTSSTLDAYCSPTWTGGLPPKNPISPSQAAVSWRKFTERVEEAVGDNLVPLDVKLVGGEQLKRWNKKEPPRYYWCQLQWQMLHTNTQHSLLIAKVGAHDIRGHLIERDDIWLDEAEERSKVFMQKVFDRRSL